MIGRNLCYHAHTKISARHFKFTPSLNRLVQASTSSDGSSDPSYYKVAFMFPGQGAQTVGMAKALCDENPAAKSLFDKASAILGYDLLAKCAEGPKEELDSTVILTSILKRKVTGNCR